MNNIAIFIRGIPGSGKTTLAKDLQLHFTSIHCEADMWMEDPIREYKFDPEKLKDCNEKCFNYFKDTLLNGFCAIVSNTFIKRWEIERYLDHCKRNHIRYIVIRCICDFGNLGVPPEKVFDMKMKFEDLKNMEELTYDGSPGSFGMVLDAICDAKNAR